MTGRLTKKIQRQESSVSAPPRIGPERGGRADDRAPDAEGGAAVAALVAGVDQRDGGGEHDRAADALHGPRAAISSAGVRAPAREASEASANSTSPTR